MQYNLDTKTKRAFRNPSDSIWRGLEWGSIGGLTGTLVMGFFHMGALIGSRVAGSDRLFNHWEHSGGFLFDAGHADGRRRSTGCGCVLSAWSGDRRQSLAQL